MTEPKIYADLCFLVNFTMDLGIFWATAKLAAVPIQYCRLVLASFIGSIYAIGFLFQAFQIGYSLPAKIFVSALLIIIALSPRGWQDFKKVFLYFYGVSFTVAGASIAVSFLLNSGIRPVPFSFLYLLGGLFCAFLIGSYADRYFANRILPALLEYRVEFQFANQSCSGKGFLDTGNGLRDPLSKRPVVVAEYKLLQNCLPDDFKFAVEASMDEDEMLDALTRTSWANRLRLVPFSSIGKKNGLMIGIRCDELKVSVGKKKLVHTNLVVGMYLDKLSSEDRYQVLIPSEILLNT